MLWEERCQYWRGSSRNNPSPANEDQQQEVLPWHGGSFGTKNLLFVTGRGQPIVIGIVGSHNSGKTTFLATAYLLLNSGRRLPNRSFAGSYTLGGWENLAHYLRWDSTLPPQFPPHTSLALSRTPGLLHLALRYFDKNLRDVLLTDAPGEWFERWAVNQNDPNNCMISFAHGHACPLYRTDASSRSVVTATTRLLTPF